MTKRSTHYPLTERMAARDIRVLQGRLREGMGKVAFEPEETERRGLQAQEVIVPGKECRL